MLAVFVVAALAFQPAVYNEFSHDDRTQVADYVAPSTALGWLRLPLEPWWPPVHEKHVYRPLARATIALQHVAHGTLAWPYYAANIALHGGVSLLVALLALRLGFTPAAAGLAGLIFAAHPLHAEAVHQVVGRAEILAAGAMLAGLIYWLRRPWAWWQALAQPVFFLAALGGKEHALLYPFYLALVACDGEWRAAGDDSRGGARLRGAVAAARRHGGVGLALAAGLGLALAVFFWAKGVATGGLLEPVETVPLEENPIAWWPFAERLPAVLGIFGYGISRMVWPLGLSPDYAYRSLPFDAGWGWGWAWVGAACLLGLGAWALVGLWRGGRAWLLIGAGVAAWLLTSNGPFVIGTALAERLWYWPSVAVCLALGWGVDALLARAKAPERERALAALAIGALLVAAAWHYAPAWRNQYAFAQWTLARFPDSWRANANLAREAYGTRDFEEGLAYARRATEIIPEQPYAWDWVGMNASFLPDGAGHEEAAAAFARAIELDPDMELVYWHFANLRAMQGRMDEAAALMRQYIARSIGDKRQEGIEKLRGWGYE